MFQNRKQISFDKGVKIEAGLVGFKHFSNSNTKYLISQGSCQSLAAASFGSQSISLNSKDNKRILELNLSELTVEVEAGITLRELDDYLFPKGFQIRCQPGHGLVTVGGAIAAETHGTNQYKFGSFSSQIRSLKLFHPDRGSFETSPLDHPEIFELTIGGFGLTGHIVSAVLDIRRINSVARLNTARQIYSLKNYFEVMNESAKLNEETHSWLRYNSKNKNLSGVIFSTNYVATKQSLSSVVNHFASASNLLRVPVNLWNAQTTALINQIYIKTYGFTFSSSYTTAARGYFLSTKSLFYYNLYGSNGFHEYSMIIDDSHLAYVLNLVHAKARHLAIPVPLVSTKPFIGDKKYLRFVGTGTCLTFNFPRNSRSEDLMKYCDDILCDVKGIPSIIKDSRLPAWVVKKTFSEYDIFKSKIIKYDSSRRFRSELSERLELDSY
jgi:decaprenylphospho-beta-D-ribofuranose 2-oxidase